MLDLSCLKLKVLCCYQPQLPSDDLQCAEVMSVSRRGSQILQTLNSEPRLHPTDLERCTTKTNAPIHTEITSNDGAFSLGVEIPCADRICVPDDVRLW